jgi:hypothetical protein
VTTHTFQSREPVKRFLTALGVALMAACVLVAPGTDARAEEWAYYAGSNMPGDTGPALRDWYGLNRLKPLAESEAPALHYYDQDSVASNFPYPGGIVRVWEKAVVQRETPNYAKAKEAVEREEEKRLKRKLTVLDAARIFPLAINRATKEIATLYEINCDTLEFFIMEGNNYDSAGDRIAREASFDMNLWVAVRPGSVMEVLSKKMCDQ